MSIDRGMDKDVVYVHNGILLSHKKNEIMLSVATWLERKTNVRDHLYVESKNMIQMNLFQKQKEAMDREYNLMIAEGKEQLGSLGCLLYLLYSCYIGNE